MVFDIGSVGNDLSRQKDKQKAAVFAYLMSHSPAARKDVSQALRLRSTTVSNIVQELIADGLVAEDLPKNAGRPGRPRFGLRTVPGRLVTATVYVEDHRFIGSLIDIGGSILARKTAQVPAGGTNADVEAAVGGILGDLIGEVPRGSEFLGTGISVVGTVDSRRRIWVNADRWPGIRDLDLGRIAEERGTGLLLRRNLDIELEYMLEKNPEWKKENTVLFHWGFGVGGSYAYQGRVLDSPFGRYMDIGHTIINPKSKRLCRCGVCGCVESEAAIYALLPTFRKKFPDLREDSVDIDRLLSDPGVFSIPGMRRAVDTVGLSLSNLFKIFYPHRMFLVGAFVRNPKIVDRLEDIILETFYEKMKQKVHRVDLVVIPDGFSGCAWANGFPFFRKRLRELLEAKL